MDNVHKNYRRKLQKMCKPSLIQLCRDAGLNQRETDMIVLFYQDRRTEDELADHFNMSRSAYHENKCVLLGKLMDFEAFIEIRSQANRRGGHNV